MPQAVVLSKPDSIERFLEMLHARSTISKDFLAGKHVVHIQIIFTCEGEEQPAEIDTLENVNYPNSL